MNNDNTNNPMGTPTPAATPTPATAPVDKPAEGAMGSATATTEPMTPPVGGGMKPEEAAGAGSAPVGTPPAPMPGETPTNN